MNEIIIILTSICSALVIGNLFLTRKLMNNDLHHLQVDLKELKNEFTAFRVQVLDYIFRSK